MPPQRSCKQLQMTHVCLLDRRSKSINKIKPNLIRKRVNELQTHFSLTAKTEVSGCSALVQSSGLGMKFPSELQPQQWSGCWWPCPHQWAPLTASVTATTTLLPEAITICTAGPWAQLPGTNGSANHWPLWSSWQPQLLSLCLESCGLLPRQTAVSSASSVSHRCCG